MNRIQQRIAAGVGLAVIGLISLTGCGQGGILGEIDRLGREDPSASEPEQQAPDVVDASLIRVIDGDTIAVEPSSHLPATGAGGREHSVRVLGIDAPEIDWSEGNHECGAEAATQRVEQLVDDGAALTLIYDDGSDRFDRFDRSLAYVETTAGDDIGATLIAEGFAAAWYPASAAEPQRHTDYAQAQGAAEESSLGSWAQCSQMGR